MPRDSRPLPARAGRFTYWSYDFAHPEAEPTWPSAGPIAHAKIRKTFRQIHDDVMVAQRYHLQERLMHVGIVHPTPDVLALAYYLTTDRLWSQDGEACTLLVQQPAEIQDALRTWAVTSGVGAHLGPGTRCSRLSPATRHFFKRYAPWDQRERGWLAPGDKMAPRSGRSMASLKATLSEYTVSIMLRCQHSWDADAASLRWCATPSAPAGPMSCAFVRRAPCLTSPGVQLTSKSRLSFIGLPMPCAILPGTATVTRPFPGILRCAGRDVFRSSAS
jgi:hypothetical protein